MSNLKRNLHRISDNLDVYMFGIATGTLIAAVIRLAMT